MSITTNDGGHGMVAAGGRKTTPLAAGVNAVAIKASAGCLGRVLVTANASAAMTIYDNASAASGTIIGYIPATATAGQMYDFQFTAANGIYASAPSGGPGVTIGWS